MKNHTIVYLSYFGYGDQDFVPSEACGNQATEIHHLINRGMGGVKNNRLDVIENLQAICRSCHNKYGDMPSHEYFLVTKHALKLKVKVDKLTEKLNTL